MVIGSIIGADIYIAAALGARLIGPASLVIWFVAGAMAMVIALSFAYCATMMPRVGGPYAYVKETMGDFAGFGVGWALFLAEWFSLAVFPVAFAQYAVALAPGLDSNDVIILKGLFILTILFTNVAGIKAAGRVNDGLTIAKLGPLLLLAVSGVTFMLFNMDTTRANYTPFFTGDAPGIGQSLVLIFWAYAGFELSTLPANEIERPERTIPKAIVAGMLVVITFYAITNLVIMGVVDEHTLTSSKSPLIDAGSAIFSGVEGFATYVPVIVGVGALVSILGADESGTIGTSRLSFALAADGLFPKVFGRLHARFHTPHVGLMLICGTAFLASIVGNLSQLINASVFLLALAYFFTCVATIRLSRKFGSASLKTRLSRAVPVAGMLFSVGLMVLVSVEQIVVSLVLVLAGIPIFVFFSPKKELRELKEAFLSREAVLRRTYEQGERFLALPWRRLVWFVYWRRKLRKPWTVHNNGD